MKGVLYLIIGLFVLTKEPLLGYSNNPLISSGCSIQQDSSKFLIVTDILLTGHKKTKDGIILRELDFKTGDSLLIADLPAIFDRNRNYLLNTNLFNQVLFDTLDVQQGYTKIKLELEERWTIFPIPILELADRNFNVWWEEYEADPKRLVYGLYVSKYNLRGRNETLIGEALFGYRTKLELRYKIPFIDKKKTIGFATRLLYRADREIAFANQNNKLAFCDHATTSGKRYAINTTFQLRKNLNTNHYWKTQYHFNSVLDTITQLNSNYFAENANKQQYFTLAYVFEQDERDLDNYPLKGQYLRGSIIKEGIGVFKDLNTIRLEANYSNYQKIGPKQYWAANVKANKIWGKDLPYFNNIHIGFLEHFIRGYELYILNVQEYLFLRTNLRQILIDSGFDNPLKNGLGGKRIAFKLVLRAFYEIAWTNDELFVEANPLNTGNIWGTGIGLDFILWENVPLSIEYTINKEKEPGFYLHFGLAWDSWKEF